MSTYGAGSNTADCVTVLLYLPPKAQAHRLGGRVHGEVVKFSRASENLPTLKMRVQIAEFSREGI